MAIVFSGDLLKNSKTFIELLCRLWLTAIFAIKNTILVRSTSSNCGMVEC